MAYPDFDISENTNYEVYDPPKSLEPVPDQQPLESPQIGDPISVPDTFQQASNLDPNVRELAAMDEKKLKLQLDTLFPTSDPPTSFFGKIRDKLTGGAKKRSTVEFFKERLTELHREGATGYNLGSLKDFNSLMKLTGRKSEVDKETYYSLIKQANAAGLLDTIRRPPTLVEAATGETILQRSYSASKSGQILENAGSPTVGTEEQGLANLALVGTSTKANGQAQLDKLITVRSARTRTAEDVANVSSLVNKAVPAEQRRREANGDSLATAIHVVDLKNGEQDAKEKGMVAEEKSAVKTFNTNRTEGTAQVLYSNTAIGQISTLEEGLKGKWGGVGTLVGKLVGSYLRGKLSKVEAQTNRRADLDIAMRSTIELARADADASPQTIKELTRNFNGYVDGIKSLQDLQTAARKMQSTADGRTSSYLNAFSEIIEAHSNTEPLSRLSGVFRALPDANVGNPNAASLRRSIVAHFSGVDDDGNKLSQSGKLSLRQALQKRLNIISWIKCKSGQDRTAHGTASSVAMDTIGKQFGEHNVANLMRNFESAVRFHENGNTEALSKLLGIDGGKASSMIESYQQEYLKNVVTLGLPVTKASTLVPGLKWRAGGVNIYSPLAHLPRTAEIAGQRIQVKVQNAKGNSNYAKPFFSYLNGLASIRKS